MCRQRVLLTLCCRPGVTHIKGDDYSAVISAAESAEGFSDKDAAATPTYLTTGFARNTVMSIAGTVRLLRLCCLSRRSCSLRRLSMLSSQGVFLGFS